MLRGRITPSRKSWMMLKVQGSTLTCKDVFDRVVVFDHAEWADDGAHQAGPAPPDADLEYGLSDACVRRKASAAKKPGVKRKREEEEDDLPEPSPASHRPKRARSVKTYKEDEEEEDDDDDDDDDEEGDDEDDEYDEDDVA